MNYSGRRIGVRVNKQVIVIADADALIAQADPNDFHHERATKISQNLISMNAQVIYPSTTIAEAATHMQRALSNAATAYGTAELMTGPSAQVAEVNKQTLINALKYFSPKTSKKNTLFDCIVAAVAEDLNADAIFSFDRFYKTKGFKSAEDLKS